MKGKRYRKICEAGKTKQMKTNISRITKTYTNKYRASTIVYYLLFICLYLYMEVFFYLYLVQTWLFPRKLNWMTCYQKWVRSWFRISISLPLLPFSVLYFHLSSSQTILWVVLPFLFYQPFLQVYFNLLTIDQNLLCLQHFPLVPTILCVIFSVSDPQKVSCGYGSGSRIPKMFIWIWIRIQGGKY